MIAALYVQTGGVYFDLPDVDPWDAPRDARQYGGPWPVVAHPPCNVWGHLAPVNQARYGHPIGDDGGCFLAALFAVRVWGGVLEHPADSYAWERYELPRPCRGGWVTKLGDPGMATEVDQAAYGHPARKRTWLYAVGVPASELRWERTRGEAVIGNGIRSGTMTGRRKVEKREASRTPEAFRDVLLELARNAEVPRP